MTKPNSLVAVASGRQMASGRNIQDYCDWLNRLNFVVASGKPYRISTNERGERYLDRQA